MKQQVSIEFFLQDDVVALARDLLGMRLCTRIDGVLTTGIITETEAYTGITDRASHAYGGRHTARTEVMFREGGIAYVYLCYGIHHLFNIVTNQHGIPHAILIRAIQPEQGIEDMLLRRKKSKLDKTLTAGPGTVSKALGITTAHTGLRLSERTIWIEKTELVVPSKSIIAGPRVGVDYAGDDALLPYRFRLQN
jgi:DNA-3-methyladenine glycosylase